jgi:tripartite-type tricarboxylate transporter receptor subunit TctC
MNRSRFLAAIGAALVLCIGLPASAQDDWPRKPIRVILPAGPGGTSDILMRRLGEQLGKLLGQPIVIDNKPGAGGTLAATLAAQAEPDGYTFMMNSIATHGIAPFMYKLRFDPERDVAGVAHVAFAPNVLYVRKDSPFKSVRDLIAYGKANPGKLSYASAGSGTSLHLAAVQFSLLAGLDLTHIPFNGAAPAMQSVLAGDTAFAFENSIAVMGQLRSGTLVALAVTTAARSRELPETPTMAEAGVRGFDIASWFGLVAPAATPRPIVDKMAAAVERALKEPQMQDAVRKLGAEPHYLGPREFDAYMKSERQKLAGVVKASGAKVE